MTSQKPGYQHSHHYVQSQMLLPPQLIPAIAYALYYYKLHSCLKDKNRILQRVAPENVTGAC